MEGGGGVNSTTTTSVLLATEDEIPETTFEFDSDVILALAFLITAIIAAKRLVVGVLPYYIIVFFECIL